MRERFAIVQFREVVRQQPLSRRAIRSGGKDRQHPSEVAFWVHADELACGDNGINHRGAPAGGRVSDKKIIPKSHFSSSEAALDWVLVYMHMTKVDFRVAHEVRPATIGVGHRIAQIPRRRGRVLKSAKLALQALQDRLCLCMAQLAALDLVDIRILDHIVVAGGDTTSFAERGLL